MTESNRNITKFDAIRFCERINEIALFLFHLPRVIEAITYKHSS